MATDRSAVPVQVSFRAIIPDPAARASSSTQKKNANASAFSTDECRISIIYDQESDAYFVTSVDLFLLTEYISGIAIQRVDKIRHRRIWEKFFPRLMSRANAPDLFVQVMVS